MNLLKYLLLIALNKIAMHAALHFKIYVPDVVNHHYHTKTVLLHVHKPAPKKPKTHKKHEYHENWSSWKSYDHSYKDQHEHPEEGHKESVKDQKDLPVHGYFPQPFVEDNNLEQKDVLHAQEPSYAVHEDVNDVPPNVESFSYNYEEGYRKGLQEEAGHIRADQTSKFHEDQHEEQDETENEGSRDEYEGKTDAGRYFVDDVEYENNRDKREGRRLRKINRI
ncbi:uncharacterized protein LOC105663221 [Megachile rotundata]|uniref:uncharacterized protein LOC105663221 n=1 Tax=Megachile rotundata TaxID=143995 RepID=UPI003FD4EFE3